MKGLTLTTKEQAKLHILNGVLEGHWLVREALGNTAFNERMLACGIMEVSESKDQPRLSAKLAARIHYLYGFASPKFECSTRFSPCRFVLGMCVVGLPVSAR
jgi:hypothetical protein